MRLLPVLLILVLAAACGPEAGDTQGTAPPDTLRILAYNIHHAEGMDEVTDLNRIAALIREVNPDLVALQEVDSVVTRTNGVDQAAELGRLTGLEPVFGRFMAYQGGAYGMSLLSRLQIVESDNLRLPDGDEPRTSVSATVRTPNGRQLRFSGIHFYRTEEERLAQATTLEEILAQGNLPEILAGDFNSEPGSAVMTYLGDRWTTLDKGDDRYTFSSFDPVREIDFVLVRPSGAFSVLQHRLLDDPVMSDHRPVLTELVMH
ncbi:MAG: endonuclease/exonuclease/phosphatase family metal-dependent hydrolase [Rhodothermales bacterium]|jgi:endonuclease/exonuclease/phosphatase family metal-dependent hydrolase